MHKYAYKMNHLSVPTSKLSYTIQNTVDVICVTNTRHQKRKDNMKKKYIFIYRYNDSCTDNEEAAVWLLHGSLACTQMNELLFKILLHTVSQLHP